MNKKYACADIHGVYNLWKQIDEYTDDTDTIYVLGDCADRGPDGWEIIKEVYNSPKTIYLQGNHEDMLAGAMLGGRDDKELYFWNGGKPTFNAWKNEDKTEKNDWYTKLKDLPKIKAYTNKQDKIINLCHSGYTPEVDKYLFGDDYIWNRSHFCEPWDEDEFREVIVIHGHTIVPTLFDYLYSRFPSDYNFEDPEILVYDNGHKIDLDLGSAFTGKVALIDLDTLETKYFYDEELYKKYVEEIRKYHSPRHFWR